MVILLIYILCVTSIYIRSLGGFGITWVLATFGSLGLCTNGISMLITIAVSAILMWMASITMGRDR